MFWGYKSETATITNENLESDGSNRVNGESLTFKGEIMLVLKVGGNEIDDPDFVEKFGATLDTLSEATMVVHGGGKEIKQLQEKLGLEAQYIAGLRVTDEESLALVQMVLAGRVNKRLVAALTNAGLDVFGMSGIDRASIQAGEPVWIGAGSRYLIGINTGLAYINHKLNLGSIVTTQAATSRK